MYIVYLYVVCVVLEVINANCNKIFFIHILLVVLVVLNLNVLFYIKLAKKKSLSRLKVCSFINSGEFTLKI